jgi:hypothetical protein
LPRHVQRTAEVKRSELRLIPDFNSKIGICIRFAGYAANAPGPQSYIFFLRYSNRAFPISAQITAIKKFVLVKDSAQRECQDFPWPNGDSEFSHQMVGIREKDDERDFNHGPSYWGEPPAISPFRMHGRMIARATQDSI